MTGLAKLSDIASRQPAVWTVVPVRAVVRERALVHERAVVRPVCCGPLATCRTLG